MRKYFSSLSSRPDHHKKRFALFVSAGFTLILFVFWSVISFGTVGGITQNSDETVVRVSSESENEASPLESFRSNLASGISSLKNSLGEIGSIIRNVNLGAGYEELRSEALDNNGR